MSSMKRLTTIALTLLAALAVAFAAAAFGAGITVYKSGFDSKGQYEALKKLQEKMGATGLEPVTSAM